ncbi:MAG: hypothetical protein R3B72_01310 [Polyangiaceae bacterium]
MLVLRARTRLAVAAGVDDDDLAEAVFEGLESGRAEQSRGRHSGMRF